MFKLIKIDNARMNVPEPEYYECSAAIKCGQPLYLYDGRLKVVTDSTKNVEFIAMADGVANATIPVCRVNNSQIWETEFTGGAADIGSMKLGVTINIQNNSILASSVNSDKAHAVITDFEYTSYDIMGDPSGGVARVRFLCLFGRDASAGK